MKGIVITTDGKIGVKDIDGWEGIKAELDDGYLELLPLGEFNGYIDEDGKRKGLEPNPLASVIVKALLAPLGRILHSGDFIVGNIVFLGQKEGDNPEDGLVECDLPLEISDTILKMAESL